MDQPPTADPLETFTLLPLSISPTSKALTSPLPHLSPALTSLSALQRTLLSTPSQTPPPPIPTNPKRSAQIQKMREQGNAALRKTSSSSSASSNNKDGGSGNGNSTAQEAITLYTYALEMALGRPGWEPSSLVREEASTLYANRAQAYMAAGMWAEGAADAGASVECKRVGNGKAWWRRGKCLCEMGKWREAGRWVREGVEVEGEKEGELVGLGREIERHVEEERRREGR